MILALSMGFGRGLAGGVSLDTGTRQIQRRAVEGFRRLPVRVRARRVVAFIRARLRRWRPRPVVRPPEPPRPRPVRLPRPRSVRIPGLLPRPGPAAEPVKIGAP